MLLYPITLFPHQCDAAQAAWLLHNEGRGRGPKALLGSLGRLWLHSPEVTGVHTESPSSRPSASSNGTGPGRAGPDAGLAAVEASLEALRVEYPDFLERIREAGAAYRLDPKSILAGDGAVHLASTCQGHKAVSTAGQAVMTQNSQKAAVLFWVELLSQTCPGGNSPGAFPCFRIILLQIKKEVHA